MGERTDVTDLLALSVDAIGSRTHPGASHRIELLALQRAEPGA